MEGPIEHDPAQLRISDDDRHQMAELLRRAAGEGRLDLDELDQRLEATYAAKVYAELAPLAADLPGAEPLGPHGAVASTAPTGLPRYSSTIVVMSGQDRKGAWEVPASHTALSVMGGVVVDLRAAVFTTPEVVINAHAVMGSVDILVNAWTRVTVEGAGIMGTFEEGKAKVEAEIGPQSPHVRVSGMALMGSVTVVRKPMPGEKRKRIRRAGG